MDTDIYTCNNIDTYTDIHHIIVSACVLALHATFFWESILRVRFVLTLFIFQAPNYMQENFFSGKRQFII